MADIFVLTITTDVEEFQANTLGGITQVRCGASWPVSHDGSQRLEGFAVQGRKILGGNRTPCQSRRSRGAKVKFLPHVWKARI